MMNKGLNPRSNSKRRFVIIHGYLGLGNLGDEASFEYVMLTKQAEGVEIIAASFVDPIDTGKLFGVKTLKDTNIIKFILTLFRTKEFIFAGGDIILIGF